MLSAFVTTVRSCRATSIRATSVVVVPPVNAIAMPSVTSSAAARAIRRFSSLRPVR